jgi:hypothetical protein
MSNDTLDQQLKQDGPLDTKSNAIKFGVIGGLGGIIISLILFLPICNMKAGRNGCNH